MQRHGGCGEVEGGGKAGCGSPRDSIYSPGTPWSLSVPEDPVGWRQGGLESQLAQHGDPTPQTPLTHRHTWGPRVAQRADGTGGTLKKGHQGHH